jgi:septal ring factor EnvC (AmiA/AmiB activator)
MELKSFCSFTDLTKMDSLAKTIESVETLFENSSTKPELAIKLLKLENINLEKTIVCLQARNVQVEAENKVLRNEGEALREELNESKTVLASLLKQMKRYETALKKELCINTSSAYYECNGELLRKESSHSRKSSNTSTSTTGTE